MLTIVRSVHPHCAWAVAVVAAAAVVEVAMAAVTAAMAARVTVEAVVAATAAPVTAA
jgi:hypothetical protein